MECVQVERKSVYSFYAWIIVASLFLLAAQTESAPLSGNTYLNAVELLTTFSDERAEQYEPLFLFSDETRIVSVEIHAVGTDNTDARYYAGTEVWKQMNNILRIKTADGFEGISGVVSENQGEFSDEQLLELQSVTTDLLDLRSLDPVEVGTMLERTRPDLSDAVRANIDIALWDLAARRAGRPLYELLGAKRDSIEPYASLPFYDSLPEYVEAVNDYAKLGYRIFKFHVWGLIEEDSKLVKLIQQTFADSPYRFMVDLEGAYGFEDALRLGGEMDEGLFIWLEGPIDDELLEQYRQLKNRLTLPIIPAGYNIYSSEFIRQGIKTGSWDAGRFDATTIGGITKALELLIIANDADLSIEIQSWGHSLAQATNLHLMLANERTRYFEASMPKEAYEFGMKNGNLLDQGQVVAPELDGLGIEVDWDNLTMADFYIKIVAP
ncbi:MAG: enolase C-terminal domain-like protein [Arenicellales bacterium]|nr:enolase C-terminal domain-like protein [Arenicellales bacterium]